MHYCSVTCVTAGLLHCSPTSAGAGICPDCCWVGIYLISKAKSVVETHSMDLYVFVSSDRFPAVWVLLQLPLVPCQQSDLLYSAVAAQQQQAVERLPARQQFCPAGPAWLNTSLAAAGVERGVTQSCTLQ